MKTLSLLSILILFVTCQKAPVDLLEPQQTIAQQPRNTIWPLKIDLGPDLTVQRTDSVSISSAYAYLPFCGVSPEYEVPVWGTEVYQISGPTQSRIYFNSGLRLGNLAPGSYTYVGHAYMEGFRLCDSVYFNDHAYDTLKLTVLKSKRKIK